MSNEPIEMLNIDDPDFAEKLIQAIGVKPGETITITTPTFDRTDGRVVPLPVIPFDNLPELSEETLKEIGCQKWDDPDAHGNVLWLYPAEWYDHIPNGHIITNICGEDEWFEHGKTDDDRRFGALSFGFKRKAA